MHKNANPIVRSLAHKGLSIATAESCSGGLLAVWLTDLPGSSAWFDRGWVTYSNESKVSELGVPQDVLARFGAVSAETVHAMCDGVFNKTQAHIVLATTGLAGPDGDGSSIPVGTVWIGCHVKGDRFAETFHFDGDRESVREQAALAALRLMEKCINRK